MREDCESELWNKPPYSLGYSPAVELADPILSSTNDTTLVATTPMEKRLRKEIGSEIGRGELFGDASHQVFGPLHSVRPLPAF